MMTKSRKTFFAMILSVAMLFCAAGFVLSSLPARAEDTTTNIVSAECKGTGTGFQFLLTFDKPGDNGNPTLGPLREYLGNLLGIEEAKRNAIYFGGPTPETASDMKILQVNIEEADIDRVPRVFTLGTELDINKTNGTCTLAEPYTVGWANLAGGANGYQIVEENTISMVYPIGKNGTQFNFKITFSEPGTYTNNYLADNMNYLVLNGKNLSEYSAEQIGRWYDASGGTVLPTFGIYPEESLGLVRNDGSDFLTILPGFITGDGKMIYEQKSYRFDGNGGIDMLGAQVLSSSETEENGKRKIVLNLSHYGNNHSNASETGFTGSDGWKNKITFNGQSLKTLGYDCWFVKELEEGPYQLGKELNIFIPEADFVNDGKDVLKIPANTLINTEDPSAGPNVKGTWMVYDFEMTFEGTEVPTDPQVMTVQYTDMRIADGQIFLNLAFDNKANFTDAGAEDYRAKTTVKGTCKDGTPYEAQPTGSYFDGKMYQIPFSLSADGDKELDLTKPITVVLEKDLTAQTVGGGSCYLAEAVEKVFTPLVVENVTQTLEGENVIYKISFNQSGADSKFGGYNDEYLSKVEVIGQKLTAEGTYEDVTYNLSTGYAGGINQDPAIKDGGFAAAWYVDGELSIYFKIGMPRTTLDLRKPLKVQVKQGFYILNLEMTTDKNRVSDTVMTADSDVYEFEGLALQDLEVKDYTKELTKGAGTTTVIEITFNTSTIEGDHGAIVSQYRGKIFLNGKSIEDPYYKGQVAAWYSEGKYQVHINNDIDPAIFDFHAPITIQVKGGFFMLDPDKTTEASDGKAYHMTPKYVLPEDSAIFKVKPLPAPIEVDEYYQDLFVNSISKFSETADNQILSVTFDRPVSYNSLPHINCPLDWLAAVSYLAETPALPYTKVQLDYIAANGLNLSVKEKIIIDGVPLGVRNDGDSSVYPNSIYVTYGQLSADVMTINFNKKGANKMDLSVEHTIVFQAGFKTPLGGRLSEDVTFRFDPASGTWSVVTEQA